MAHWGCCPALSPYHSQLNFILVDRLARLGVQVPRLEDPLLWGVRFLFCSQPDQLWEMSTIVRFVRPKMVCTYKFVQMYVQLYDLYDLYIQILVKCTKFVQNFVRFVQNRTKFVQNRTKFCTKCCLFVCLFITHGGNNLPP